MHDYRLRALALAFVALPFTANSTPITYNFEAKGNSTGSYGTPPSVPAALGDATSWDIKGSIIVDNDQPAVYDDPRIRLDQQIVGGSLSVNGLSAGNFDNGDFSYYFMDGFEESSLPYDAAFELDFKGHGDFGPSQFVFYTEDLDWGDPIGGSGPDISGIAFDDAAAFLKVVGPDDYQEIQLSLGDGGNRWDLYGQLTTGFESSDGSTAVPEPASALLLGLGLVGPCKEAAHGRQ